MLARYYFPHRVVITFAAVLIGTLSSRAQVVDLTVPGNLTVNGNTDLQGTLDVAQGVTVAGNTALQGTLDVTQGVTVIGDTDLMGNIFSIGHSLNGDNSQNYGIAGFEMYIKNTNSTTRLIEQVTPVDGTTFKWGTRAATDLNANGILDDFGTEWMSLTGSTLTITGNLLINGTDNQLTAQTLTGVNSILTQGLADARYVQLAGTTPLTISNATAATSSITGALIVSGGLGVAKDAYINGVRVGLGSGSVTSNTALGSGSLSANTTGSNNTAGGENALYSNTTGIRNTANGVGALRFNTTGNYNTASGMYALYGNTSGSYNAASGYQALYSNTAGSHNVASGLQALYSNTTGSNNTALGLYAGGNLSVGNNNVYIGAYAQSLSNSDNNSIVIGYSAIGEGANTTVIGNSSTISAHIYGDADLHGAISVGRLMDDTNLKGFKVAVSQDAHTLYHEVFTEGSWTQQENWVEDGYYMDQWGNVDHYDWVNHPYWVEPVYDEFGGLVSNGYYADNFLWEFVYSNYEWVGQTWVNSGGHYEYTPVWNEGYYSSEPYQAYDSPVVRFSGTRSDTSWVWRNPSPTNLGDMRDLMTLSTGGLSFPAPDDTAGANRALLTHASFEQSYTSPLVAGNSYQSFGSKVGKTKIEVWDHLGHSYANSESGGPDYTVLENKNETTVEPVGLTLKYSNSSDGGNTMSTTTTTITATSASFGGSMAVNGPVTLIPQGDLSMGTFTHQPQN